jgi:hypothetical protein
MEIDMARIRDTSLLACFNCRLIVGLRLVHVMCVTVNLPWDVEILDSVLEESRRAREPT